MKYQILMLSYLLFTLPTLAQNTLLWTVADSSSDFESYTFQSDDTPADLTYNINYKGQTNFFEGLELTTYDLLGNFKRTFYFGNSSSQNKTIVDEKFDYQNNSYVLSSKTINNQKMMVLEKYSDSNILQWEFSIECFSGTSYDPQSINILEDNKILIACYKQNGLEERESSLFYLSSEGEFLSEIAFK
jgi:hypothetical protein